MEMKTGAKVVYTNDSHSIIFDVVSKDIKLTQNAGILNVDKKVFQYTLIPNPALSLTDTTLERQKAELLGYIEYEVSYMKNELKLDVSNITKKWVTINNKLFLFWAYDMPPDNKSVLQQINLSTLCFANVLNLNNAVPPGEKAEINAELLSAAAKTLQLSNVKTDLNTLYKKLQEEMKQ